MTRRQRYCILINQSNTDAFGLMHLQSFAECLEKKQAADASLFSSSVITNTCCRLNTKSKPVIVHVAQNVTTVRTLFLLMCFPSAKSPANATAYP